MDAGEKEVEVGSQITSEVDRTIKQDVLFVARDQNARIENIKKGNMVRLYGRGNK